MSVQKILEKNEQARSGLNLIGKMSKLLIEGLGRCRVKKKVRFADDVVESSSNNEKY
ncbi:hypothetical protein Syun_001919 [Stephania yunnanensis]|uniref:Uncharacterized protein n=1 Tax=Stephania yunnanensis TaxID=152371 RepID=A0AAP0Q8A1_9MAGN